jgi:hypothetical protein
LLGISILRWGSTSSSGSSDVIPQLSSLGARASGALHAWVRPTSEQPKSPTKKLHSKDRKGEKEKKEEEEKTASPDSLLLFFSWHDESQGPDRCNLIGRRKQDLDHAANVVGAPRRGSLEKAQGCRRRVRWCLVALTDRISARRGQKKVRHQTHNPRPGERGLRSCAFSSSHRMLMENQEPLDPKRTAV